MTGAALHDALAEAVGPGALAHDGQLPLFAVDGAVPKAAAAPESVDAAAALLRLANESRPRRDSTRRRRRASPPACRPTASTSSWKPGG